MKIYNKIAELIELNRPFTLAVVIRASGSTPGKPGAKMIVFPNGDILGTVGGGALEQDVINKAVALMDQKSPKAFTMDLKDDLGMICGGEIEVYLEPFQGNSRLLVFGAGHIGLQLVPLAVKLGFSVIVIDERENMNTKAQFPDATKRAVEDPMEFIGSFEFSENDHIVIITHKHVHDRKILGAIIDKPVNYMGMIGSNKKVQQTFESLENDGVDSHLFEKVHSPIGFGIKAETPEEIAVLIAAELVKVRYS